MKFAGHILIVAAVFVFAGCDEEMNNGNAAAAPNTQSSSPEIVLVSIAGWTQGPETMDAIESSMVRSLKGCFPNHTISIKRRFIGLLPEGDSELFLGLEYDAWRQKKNTPAGKDNMFVAVGHSSGATAIYSLMRNGTFKEGPEAPAFLGLVDMVLPLGPHDLTGKVPGKGTQRTTVVHYHLFETDSIVGIRNVVVRGDHFSIVNSFSVMQGLAGGAVSACQQIALGQENVQPQTAQVSRWKTEVSSR